MCRDGAGRQGLKRGSGMGGGERGLGRVSGSNRRWSSSSYHVPGSGLRAAAVQPPEVLPLQKRKVSLREARCSSKSAQRAHGPALTTPRSHSGVGALAHGVPRLALVLRDGARVCEAEEGAGMGPHHLWGDPQPDHVPWASDPYSQLIRPQGLNESTVTLSSGWGNRDSERWGDFPEVSWPAV